MSKEKISIWVHKQLTGQLNAAEQDELDKVLAADASHQQLARDVEAVWEKTGTLGDDIQFDAAKAYQRFKANVSAQQQTESHATPKVTPISSGGARRVFLRYATAAAAVVVLGFFAVRWFGSDLKTINSGATAMLVSLPDGSSVRLAPKSKISFDSDKFATHRNISLKGSALFEVSKSGLPFDVKAGKMQVSVLGTTFMVTSENENHEVKVLEGRVAVQTNDHDRQEISGKQGVVLVDGTLTRVEEADFSHVSWTDPEMAYNNEPLSRVISDIESKFGVKISVKGVSSLEKCTFTSGSLKNNTLEEILSLLEATYSTKITKKADGEFQVSGLSCS